MLEKVQVTPGHLRGVIGLHPFPAAVGAGERTSRLEVDSNAQALVVNIE
jgi:hypothetical protein